MTVFPIGTRSMVMIGCIRRLLLKSIIQPKVTTFITLKNVHNISGGGGLTKANGSTIYPGTSRIKYSLLMMLIVFSYSLLEYSTCPSRSIVTRVQYLSLSIDSLLEYSTFPSRSIRYSSTVLVPLDRFVTRVQYLSLSIDSLLEYSTCPSRSIRYSSTVLVPLDRFVTRVQYLSLSIDSLLEYSTCPSRSIVLRPTIG